uniref:ArdC family protein n=1 Tax=Turicimonas muris TaxID=1796652 RepID=UPI00261FFF22
MEKTSFEKLAEDVSSKFADLIEAGKAPWSMGGSIPEYPVDAISGKPLAGITALQLLMKEKSAGFSDNRWLTEPQIATLGGKISKGARARGIPSVVWTETTAGKQTQTKIPTTYYNVEQCENLSRLPPRSPYNQNPRDLMSDICVGFGINPE